MAEPTINEIVNIPTETSRSPEVVPVYNNQAFLQGLNQQAQFKAENDWRKYNTFVNNLKDVYKNLDEIQAQDVMTEDRDILKKQAEDIFAGILKNPNAIYSPDLQTKIGKLRSDSTESKQNYLFDKANREYIARNPDLNTEENKSIIDSFRTKKLGERQLYNLDMPAIVDLDQIHDAIIKDPSVGQPWADSQISDEFIVESSGMNYLRNPYLQRWDAALNNKQDKNGKYISKYANQLYNKLPESEKKRWDQNGGLAAFWHNMGEQRFGSESDIRTQAKENVQANPSFLKRRSLDEDVRHHKAMEGIGWYNATKPDKAATAAKENLEGNALNDIVLNETTSKPGLYTMTGAPGANKERLANIQRLLGTFKKEISKGKWVDVPVLTDEMIKSTKESDKITYRVQNIDGKPMVTEMQIGKNGKWYNRNFFKNQQLGTDKEPLKGERYQYETEQRGAKPIISDAETLMKKYNF